jgi:cobalt/nickel transport system ATP-binding protein
MTAVFRLTAVGYQYGPGVEALAGVDLTIDPGERLAILGANGSGKSTLLKVLAGLAEPTQGEVAAFGERISGGALSDEAVAQRFRRRVGMVFQSADAQLFNPTVRDEVAFGPLHLDLPHDEIVGRVEDTLAMLGLGALAERAPYNLSGGEKKKVALASVLSINPEVLMLDEPTNGLDPRTQEWLIELLATLNRAGKTIVVATHQLDVLERLVDRAVVLGEDHRPAADGPLSDVLADRDLLLAVNLIHEHAHHHGALLHSHSHAHPPGKEHHAEGQPEHEHDHEHLSRPRGHQPEPAGEQDQRGHGDEQDQRDHGDEHDHVRRDGVAAGSREHDAGVVATLGGAGSIGVRAARKGDEPALAALSSALGYRADAVRIERRLSVLAAGVDDVVFVAVTESAEVVGFVHVAERRLLVSEPFVELEGLIVAAAARRRGVAGLLIAAAERWGLGRGVGELRVRARLERDVADLVYRRRGFELEKKQRVFSKRLEGSGATDLPS